MVEIIGVIAAIAAVSAIGFVTVTNTRQFAEATKLEQDVESINRSVQVYLSNGGNLTAATTTDAVLTKLKSRGDSSQMLGVTSSMLDARIVPDYGDSSRRLRARWIAADNRFIIEQGTAGVVEFRLDETLAATAPSSDTATRTAPGTLATSGGWVWDTSQPTEQVLEMGNTPGTAVAINASAAALLSHPGLTGGAYEVGPSGTVSTDNLYFDGGGYSSPLGVFSMEGMGNPPFDLTTEAGRHAFMEEALQRVIAGGSQGGVAMDRNGEGHDLSFTPGTLVAFIMIPNDTFANALNHMNSSADPSTNDVRYPLTSLSYSTGNVEQFSQSQAVNLGNDVMAFEDLPGGGDEDFEDDIWKTTGLSQPTWATTTAVDPATYYADYDNPQTGTVEHTNLLNSRSNTLLNGTRPTLRSALQQAGALPPP